MPIGEVIELVKTGGGICAVLLLLALVWMNKQLEKAHAERKEAQDELKHNNEKLQNLSERTLVVLAEIKVLFGSR